MPDPALIKRDPPGEMRFEPFGHRFRGAGSPRTSILLTIREVRLVHTLWAETPKASTGQEVLHADRSGCCRNLEIGRFKENRRNHGAAGGMGKAAALEFARRGYNIVAVARSEKGLGELVSECELSGAVVLAQVADVTDRERMGDVARNAVDTFGRIDVWVNNAGALLINMFSVVANPGRPFATACRLPHRPRGWPR